MALSPRHRHRLAVAALYGGLIGLGWWISQQWNRMETVDPSTMDPAMLFQILAVSLPVFIITSALPFVPGAEIGLGLMVLFGSKVALLVYGAMVIALTLAYLAGAMVSPDWIVRFFAF